MSEGEDDQAEEEVEGELIADPQALQLHGLECRSISGKVGVRNGGRGGERTGGRETLHKRERQE